MPTKEVEKRSPVRCVCSFYLCKLDSQIRSQAGQRHRLAAQFGSLALSEDPAPAELEKFQQHKGELRAQIESLDLEIEKLKQEATAHHIAVKSSSDTLTVRLHHFTQAAQDQAIEKLFAELNATQTIFPGTRLRLIFKIGSS